MRKLALFLFAGIFYAGALAGTVWTASDIQPLTSGDGIDSEAVWSPDGKSIAFERQEGKALRLMLLDCATGKASCLAGDEKERACYPAWTPQGEIVYSTYDCSLTAAQAAAQKLERGCNLLLRKADGTTRELTRGRWRDYTPSISPDGKAVYFATTKGRMAGGSGSSLARCSLATPGAAIEILKPYQEREDDMGGVSPSLSPDGATLAWAESPGSWKQWRIAVAPITNLSSVSYLTEAGMSAYSPRWSPDGKRLICTAFRRGDPGWSVYLIERLGGALTRVDVGPGISKSPAWSPDGNRLVFENNRTGRYKLYSCRLNETQKPFEVVALVDHYDYFDVPGIDIETPEGCRKILDAVLATGASTVLWRPRTGGLPRCHSCEQEASGPSVRPGLDKRRLSVNAGPILGWQCMGESDQDLIAAVLPEIRARGKSAGLHWTIDDNHWCNWTTSTWVFEHPEYWCQARSGELWPGRCSLAYSEVWSHKLRVMDEMLALHPDTILFDIWRNGAWSPAREYVPPQIAAWRARYGGMEPPQNLTDVRWCALVAERTTAYFSAVRKRIKASGKPVRMILFTSTFTGKVTEQPDDILVRFGVDWRRLVDEHLIDALAVKDVRFDPKRVFESTLEIYRSITAYCKGKCKVLFPVQAYDFCKAGMPSYQKATGLTQPQVATELLRLAREAGGDGVVLEVVDANNYLPATCTLLKAAARQ